MPESSSLSTDGVPTGSPGGPDEVELRLPADGAYASVLRTLTAGLAARLDFTMDDIEDLRIAVSEAAAMVLEEADPASTLECSFRLGEGELSLTVAAAAAAPGAADYESFAWQVLATLAAEAAIDSAPGRFAVRLTVRSALAS